MGMGEQQRGILQAQDEAARQTQMQQIYEPYQRLGFYSDILRGAPSTQSTITMGSQPEPSLLNQALGAGNRWFKFIWRNKKNAYGR